MKSKLLIGLFVAAAIVAGGCSGSTDPELVQGDVNDPAFQSQKGFLEMGPLMAIGGIDLGLDMARTPDSAVVNPIHPRRVTGVTPDAAVDTFSYSYDTVSGWHVAYAVFSDSGTEATLIDSVRLLDAADNAQQDWNDSTIDFVHSIVHLTMSMDDSLQSGDASFNFNFTIDGLTGSLVTVDGTESLGFSGSTSDPVEGTCSFNMGFSNVVNDVTFLPPASETDGVCPLSGQVASSGSLSMSCTGPNGNISMAGEWDVDAMFNNDGTMTITAVSDNVIYQYTETLDCQNWENPFGVF